MPVQYILVAILMGLHIKRLEDCKFFTINVYIQFFFSIPVSVMGPVEKYRKTYLLFCIDLFIHDFNLSEFYSPDRKDYIFVLICLRY